MPTLPKLQPRKFLLAVFAVGLLFCLVGQGQAAREEPKAQANPILDLPALDFEFVALSDTNLVLAPDSTKQEFTAKLINRGETENFFVTTNIRAFRRGWEVQIVPGQVVEVNGAGQTQEFKFVIFSPPDLAPAEVFPILKITAARQSNPALTTPALNLILSRPESQTPGPTLDSPTPERGLPTSVIAAPPRPETLRAPPPSPSPTISAEPTLPVNDRPAGEPPSATPTGAPQLQALPAQSTPVGVRVKSSQSYVIGTTRYVVGEVINDSSTSALYLVTATASFVDSSGQPITTKETKDYVYPREVAPGSRSAFKLALESAPTTITTQKLNLGQDSTAANTFRKLEVRSKSITINGETKVTGEIYNDQAGKVQQVKVVATFYDASGEVIDTGLTTLDTLNVGQGASYTISDFRGGLTPSSYDVQADGLLDVPTATPTPSQTSTTTNTPVPATLTPTARPAQAGLNRSSDQASGKPGAIVTYSSLVATNVGGTRGTFSIRIVRSCSTDLPGCTETLNPSLFDLEPSGTRQLEVLIILPKDNLTSVTAQTIIQVCLNGQTCLETDPKAILLTTASEITNTPTNTDTPTITPTPSRTVAPTLTPTPLSHVCRDYYEDDDNFDTARYIDVNVPQPKYDKQPPGDAPDDRRAICPAGDEDWLRFGAVGGKKYTIAIIQMADGIDLSLALYSKDRQRLAFNDDFYNPVVPTADPNDFRNPHQPTPQSIDVRPRIQSWVAPITGEYIIQVRDNSGRGGQDRTYTIIVLTESYGPTPVTIDEVCQDLYEPDGLPEQAKLIVSNEVQRDHRLCPVGDADWVKFFAKAGKHYFIFTDTRPYMRQDKVNDKAQSGADTVLTLVDRDGVSLLEQNDDIPGGETLDSQVEFKPEVDGFYYAQVKNVGDIGNQFIRYDMTLKLCIFGKDGTDPDCGRSSVMPTPLNSPTAGPSASPTETAASLDQKTPTLTLTPKATATPTLTATAGPSPTPTLTVTGTPATATPTPTATLTLTPN